MGKNWKGRGGGGGGGGGGDLASCRGYAAVIGTCDAAREKESNKELSNLLNQAIEQLYPPIQEKPQEDISESSTKHESIEDMLRSEVLQVKQQKKNGQDVMSINIGIKGIVFAKINRRDVCPVKLVKSILDRVKEEKVPCSRHLVKIIPLQLVYFAGETDLISTAKLFVEGTFISTESDKTLPQLQLSKVQHKRKAPTTEEEKGEDDIAEVSSDKTHDQGETVKKIRTETKEEEKDLLPESSLPVTSGTNPVIAELAPTAATDVIPTTNTVDLPAVVPPPLYNGPEVRYFILFKARNHNTLNKTMVIQRMRECMPVNIRQDYMNGQNAVIVEALKNVAGISYFADYYEYSDLNLRKHQALHCPQTSTGLLIQQKNDMTQSSAIDHNKKVVEENETVVEDKNETVVVAGEEKTQ